MLIVLEFSAFLDNTFLGCFFFPFFGLIGFNLFYIGLLGLYRVFGGACLCFEGEEHLIISC